MQTSVVRGWWTTPQPHPASARGAILNRDTQTKVRTFVLGAGASRHAGYPLTRDLGSELAHWFDQHGPPELRGWFDPAAISKRVGSINDIEEVLAALEQNQHPERFGLLDGIRWALSSYFDWISQNNEAPLYRRLAGLATNSDAFITFNYDTSLETELHRAGQWSIRDGYAFNVGLAQLPASQIKVLKLHGSVNWMDSIAGGLGHGDFAAVPVNPNEILGPRPVIPPQFFQRLGHSCEIRDPNFRGGGALKSGSMILPSRSKSFDSRVSLWTHLWSQAERALRTTDEIIVVGYSLPAADEKARRLLLNAGNKNARVHICSGKESPRIAKEFRAHGFPNVAATLPRFEDWLNNSQPRQPA
jgi:hypothetical protein